VFVHTLWEHVYCTGLERERKEFSRILPDLVIPVTSFLDACALCPVTWPLKAHPRNCRVRTPALGKGWGQLPTTPPNGSPGSSTTRAETRAQLRATTTRAPVGYWQWPMSSARMSTAKTIVPVGRRQGRHEQRSPSGKSTWPRGGRARWRRWCHANWSVEQTGGDTRGAGLAPQPAGQIRDARGARRHQLPTQTSMKALYRRREHRSRASN
jgi:hypothetical protein